MARYLLVDENGDIRTVDSKRLPNPTGHPSWRWLEEVISRPPHDPSTEVVEQPMTTITATEYRTVYAVRKMTGAERVAYKQAAVDEFLDSNPLAAKAMLAIMDAMRDPIARSDLPNNETEMAAWLETL